MNIGEAIGKVIEAGGIEEANRQEVTSDLKKAIVFQTVDDLPQEEKDRLTNELRSKTPEDVYGELSQGPLYTESLQKATEFVLSDWLAEVLPEDEETQRETLGKIETMN